MGQLVEFPMTAGGSVLVEVTEHATAPVMQGLKGTEIAEPAQQTFEEAIGRVRPAVQAVIVQLRSLADAPDEVHVEFGLNLHAEAGAYIAAVGTTANFTVALTCRGTSTVSAETYGITAVTPTCLCLAPASVEMGSWHELGTSMRARICARPPAVAAQLSYAPSRRSGRSRLKTAWGGCSLSVMT